MDADRRAGIAESGGVPDLVAILGDDEQAEPRNRKTTEIGRHGPHRGTDPESLFRIIFANAPTLDGPELAALSRTACEHGIDVVIGLQERRGASLFNSVAWLAADGRRGHHRKIMPTLNERLIWAAADGSTIGHRWESWHGPMGALICWEHWMPLARAARHATGEVLHFALWLAVGERHQLASRHYAFEGQCFVAAAGTMLTRDDVVEGFRSLGLQDEAAMAMIEAIPADRILLKDGGSALIAPDASYVVRPDHMSRDLVIDAIETVRVTEGRLYLDTQGHYARPDIFELRIDTGAKPGVRYGGGDEF